MEIDDLWRDMKEDKGIHRETLTLKKVNESKNPIRILRKNLLANLVFGLVISVGGVYLMFLFQAISIQLSLGVLILESQYFHWRIYQRIKAFNQLLKNWDQPILQTLQEQLTLTRKTLRMIEVRSMIFLPLAYLAGLLVGGSGDGVSADDLIMDVSFLLQGMGLALLTMPLIYFLMKWMHKKAFGDFIEQTENILKQGDRIV
ncbi:hypothetical protein [Mongoliitalea lutea]|uniref:Uncharacterized protein n=1 Tax=Mongoliitalea lutea TaxID=849756 RepID=A0A8J3G5N5_9BACT|nr:hypothetical protein [Mongoliitalea lutea]GHB40745.1 hypothetical protein GCM10008106_22320 [Mongoliitalea lutea]